MKYFIIYTEPEANETTRILELTTPKGLPPRGNSLAMMAQEAACVGAVTSESKVHSGVRFLWGHEESDGRTWLHGMAVDGVYSTIGGPTIAKRRMRELITDRADGTQAKAATTTDPFEIYLTNPPFPDWTCMTFKLDGIEVGSIYKGEE